VGVSSGMYFVVWAFWEFLLDFGFLGFWVLCVRRFLWVFFCGLVGCSCVLRSAFRFFNKVFLLNKKNKKY